ncbi:MAG: [Fe-Fe] hydrogenase large subunit C-terminal domain-containing protein [Anaerovoracaceae bacterium]
MSNFTHSVKLDKDKCCGCTTCVKRCPTEAIRVRGGKAIIISERCIDCGECIRVCPHHAKKAVVDSLDIIHQFEYTIALPAPSFYAQFPGLRDRNVLLTALKKIGFDEVFEVSAGAEAVSRATMMDLNYERVELPVISCACPAVVRIIRTRFPSLLPHLLPYRTPMDVSARWAKKIAMEKTGLPKEKIGCIFISPCPAKSTSTKMPLGEYESYVDGVVSMSELYPVLQPKLKTITDPEALAFSGATGVSWAKSGGEALASQALCNLAADGIENVISVLEALEDDRIHQAQFIELNGCIGGCVGGALTVENTYIAKSRLVHIMNTTTSTRKLEGAPDDEIMREDFRITYEPHMLLDSDVGKAMEKLARIEEQVKRLSGKDCGACGAPTCRALAEDIINGYGKEEQCVFLLREKLEKLLEEKEENQKEGKKSNGKGTEG